MLKEEEAVNVLDPPMSGLVEWFKSFFETLILVINNPELMAVIAMAAAGSALVATLLLFTTRWFQQRRRRKRGLWMTDQERWTRMNRDVADVINDVVWDKYVVTGLVEQEQAEEYLNRMAKAMKSYELQTQKKTRGPLTADYQQKMCNMIRNRVSGPLYWMADKVSGQRVKRVLPIPGDPPPKVEAKPKRQKGKLSLTAA